MSIGLLGVLAFAVVGYVCCLLTDSSRTEDANRAKELSRRWRANDPEVREWAAHGTVGRILTIHKL